MPKVNYVRWGDTKLHWNEKEYDDFGLQSVIGYV